MEASETQEGGRRQSGGDSPDTGEDPSSPVPLPPEEPDWDPGDCVWSEGGEVPASSTLIDGIQVKDVRWNPEKLVWYFAYGSNQSLAKFCRRVGVFALRAPMGLYGFRLSFSKLCSRKATEVHGFANIVPDAAEVVYGIGYLMSVNGLGLLDRYEGVAQGHYVRREVCCTPLPRPRQALGPDQGHAKLNMVAYIATPKWTRQGLVPTKGYLQECLGGKTLLPLQYARFLEATKVSDPLANGGGWVRPKGSTQCAPASPTPEQQPQG
eukprot:TRINITY_DN22750_c0_g1_i1.p1 TRINITY_DN22750_c0_g1~~TRINITY_DN22750_c0_g1_i1.p1  ORF type:complete len:266 (+),score=27.55 TRINITY_DN22750_c0_g1_i1:140-937(+)